MTEVTKPVEMAGGMVHLRVLADVLRYALTMFIRGGNTHLMDYKLVYAVLGCINLVSAK